MVRGAGAGGVAAGLGLLCGIALTGDLDATPARTPGGVARRPSPRRPRGDRRDAPVLPLSAAPSDSPPSTSPAVAPPAVATPPAASPPCDDPHDLARALPAPEPAFRLLNLLEGHDDASATAAAEALGTTSAGREVLVTRLSRAAADEAEAVDLACLESLARVGRVEDVPALLSWARRSGAVGALGAWSVRAICERERVEAPDELREVAPYVDPADDQPPRLVLELD